MDPQGIEPWSVSRRVSLSFTCVVAMSLTTEFEDSAFDLSPCFSHLCPGSPEHQPVLWFAILPATKTILRRTGYCLLGSGSDNIVVCNYVFLDWLRAGREPLTRERTFLPTSKPVEPVVLSTLHQVGVDVQKDIQ